MKIKFPGYLPGLSILVILFWIISCSGKRSSPSDKGIVMPAEKHEAVISPLRMVLPPEDATYKLGEPVKVKIESLNKADSFDSLKVYFDGRQVEVIKSEPWECIVPPSLNKLTGRRSVKAVGYSSDKAQSLTRFVTVYSDTRPASYKATVVNSYPHDREAFTQGLFYNDGVLYEGTGQESGSSLREVELETGKVIRQHNLDPSLFGEGIALYDDRIYQVTWQNKIGFVYKKSDFSLLNRLYYQTEGWGLTTLGDKLVMSDGSNILYFLDPDMFTVTSRLEVYDDGKKVDKLNELEYINGEIWANIWTTDLIARIDPVSGKVNSYVDLSMLFPEARRREVNADVLNGIAWDSISGRIFVTGKRWPLMYEIRVPE